MTPSNTATAHRYILVVIPPGLARGGHPNAETWTPASDAEFGECVVTLRTLALDKVAPEALDEHLRTWGVWSTDSLPRAQQALAQARRSRLVKWGRVTDPIGIFDAAAR
jgi:hypothetical protein